MDNFRKIKSLAEDYENAQRIIDGLRLQLNDALSSDEYMVGRKIRTSRWLRLIGIAYDIVRSIKSQSPYGSWRAQKPSACHVTYTNTLALYDRKIAVYTCMIGGYDHLQEPLCKPANVDYIVVTDGPLPSSGAWKGIDSRTVKGIPQLDDVRTSRYIKLHPHLFLNDYVYSIYIDANIKPVGDLRYLVNLLNPHGFISSIHRTRKCVYEELEACVHLKKDDPMIMRKQIDVYRKAAMPEKYGLIEANLLVRNHHHPACIQIMEHWWQEIITHSRRDQLSLPFVLWKMGIPVSEIGKIGNNIYEMPLIKIHSHVNGDHGR